MMLMKLAFKRLKNQWKSTVIMFFAIFIAVFFVSFIGIYQYNESMIKQQTANEMYGKWQGMVVEQDDASSFAKIGEMREIAIIDSECVIGSFDETMLELANFKLLEGRYPKNNQEIIIDINTLDYLGKAYEINQTLSFDVNGTMQSFKVVGIIPSYRKNWVSLQLTQYPSIITTDMEGKPYYFVYDNAITKSNVGSYPFSAVNIYSYPSLDLNQSETNHMDMMQLFNGLIMIAGFVIVATVFYQTIWNRKEQLYALCRIGINERLLRMEAAFQAILLCVIAIPIGILLAIGVCFMLYMGMYDMPILSYFSIPYLDVLIKGCVMFIGVPLFFIGLTQIIIASWHRSIKQIKKTKKNRFVSHKLGLVVCILLFSVLSVFSTKEVLVEHRNYKFYQLGANSTADYVFYDWDANRISDIPLSDIEDIRQIYGIDKQVTYGYRIPVSITVNENYEDNEFDKSFELRSFNKTKDEFKEMGIIFSDEEYASFEKGESVVLVKIQDMITEKLMYEPYIQQLYDGNQEVDGLNQTLYMNGDIPIILDSFKMFLFTNNKEADIASTLNPGELLCSTAFIEKHFDVKDGPYQFVSVNANQDADYDVTDKRMSEYGFINYRLEFEMKLNERYTALLFALIRCISIYILFMVVIINLWNSYLHSHQRDISIMQMIGVKDRYIISKYLRNIVLCFPLCMLLGMILHVGYTLFKSVMHSLQLGFPFDINECMNTLRYILEGEWHWLPIVLPIYLSFVVVMILLVYYLMRNMLHKDLLTKLNEN